MPKLRIKQTCAKLSALVVALTLLPMPPINEQPQPPVLRADAATKTSSTISEQEAYEIGVEAYTYLYPLVLMDVTRRQATNIEPNKVLGRGPMNMFTHAREFPPGDFRDVVRPNFDTLYSAAWLDLTKEPVIVSVPDTQGRYYLLPLLDMWTDVFASPGKRTTGTGAARFAIVPPGWQGKLPSGVERIDAPTPYVWIIGRTQTNGPEDYAAVNKVQDGYTVTPLSQLGKPPQPIKVTIDPTVDMKTPPLFQLNRMPADQFFSYAAELIKLHPPHLTDQPILARMKRIGFEVGKPYDLSKVDPAVKRALEKAAPNALKMINEKYSAQVPRLNGWLMRTSSGVYGTNYLNRATMAMHELGTNLLEDAIYPNADGDSQGQPLLGSTRYVMTFPKGALPPVNAFWSLTLYDKDGFQIPNPLNRFALGDRDPLKYNADGSLTLYVQSTSPGADKESNWLPSPAKGSMILQMRLYWPKSAALNGDWAPPPLQKQP